MPEAVKRYSTFADRVNPLAKILVAIGLFLTVILIHDPNHLFHLAVIMCLLLFILSGVKYIYIVLLTAAILFFGFISSLYMIFYGEGTTTIFRLGIIHVTEESAVRGLHIMMRGITLSFFGALIVFTTRITDVFYSLMQQGRLKPKYAYSFMAAVRMAPIIAGEYMALRRARKVRRALIRRKYISGLKGFTSTVVTLLSQSIRRAWRLGVAMESKGFNDGPRTYYHRTTYSIHDFYFVLLIVLSVILSSFLGEWFSPFDTVDAR